MNFDVNLTFIFHVCKQDSIEKSAEFIETIFVNSMHD